MKIYLFRIYCAIISVGYLIALYFHLYTYHGIILYHTHPFLFLTIIIIGILSNITIKFFISNPTIIEVSASNFYLIILRIIKIVSIVYVLCNIIACEFLMKFGEPTLEFNKYVIIRHGAIIQILTHSQYLSQKIYEFRLNSGFVLWFYVIAIYCITDIVAKKNKCFQ